MKNHLFLLLIVLFYFNGCSKQIERTNDFEMEKLEIICRVWGFLKYYHPTVAKGNINWDSVLIVHIDKSLSAIEKREFNKVITDLIYSCEVCIYKGTEIDTPEIRGELYKEISFDWLEDTTVISNDNIIILRSLLIDKIPDKNFYVSQDNTVGNLYFDNEKIYADSVFPSRNYRLLGLFRYWNIINYFYPYLELNDVSWDTILKRYIPRFLYAKDTLDYHLTVMELTAQLNDGHVWTLSNKLNLYFGIYSLPLKLRLIDNCVTVSEFFSDSIITYYNIKLGDVIKEINGRNIGEMIEERKRYYSFSNVDHYYRRILEDILSTKTNDSIDLTIERLGTEYKISVKPYFLYELYSIQEREDIKKSSYYLIGDSIGYVNLKYLEINEVANVFKNLLDKKAIIIDIRNYPHNVLYELSKFINPHPIDFAGVFIPDINFPGQYIRVKNIQTGINNKSYYKGELMLLVDERTQSHAEFTAMCLQSAPNVTTIGSITAGADGNVSYIYFPGEIITYFTNIGILYPDGTQTQQIGIKIDSYIRPTVEDLQNDIDRLIITAIELSK